MFPQIKTAMKQSLQTTPDFDFKLNFDGCSKGNPGLAGAGAVITYLDEELWSGYEFIGSNYTNNYAEFYGLILGLNKAIDMNINKIIVVGDSQLVINQMKGIYQCNSINLLPLYNKAKELERNFDFISYEHVLRHKNKRADALSNLAIKNMYK